MEGKWFYSLTQPEMNNTWLEAVTKPQEMQYLILFDVRKKQPEEETTKRRIKTVFMAK